MKARVQIDCAIRLECPTEDDLCILGVTSANQGKFLVYVKREGDPADIQVDNYGRPFQQYKATFDPGDGAVNMVSVQPPPVLPS